MLGRSEVFKIIPASGKTLWLLGVFTLLFALLMVALLCLSSYIAYSSRHVQFELSSAELQIRGDLYGRRIPITSLVTTRALILDISPMSPYQPSGRTNGIGLPGYRSGWFKLRNGDKALLFVTDPHSVVYLPTVDGYSLLMSVKEPERFLQSLRQVSWR